MGWLDGDKAGASSRAPQPPCKTLVIGCGLGDDAEELARRGFEVVAFDVSPSAIQWCRTRFRDSAVRYCVADLFSPPAEWGGAFDLVVEIYTLQVLPSKLHREAAQRMAQFVAPGGLLLVITRGRSDEDSPGEMPWPLTTGDLQALSETALAQIRFEDYMDGEQPPVRRFRVAYRRD